MAEPDGNIFQTSTNLNSLGQNYPSNENSNNIMNYIDALEILLQKLPTLDVNIEFLKEKQNKFTAIICASNVNFLSIGQEPWPDDVKLYQPYETEQILLPDNANCLAVQAFLKMCHLKYEVVYRANAEDMSPSGRVPFIKCGAFLVSDLEPITSFVATKGISLTADLDSSQKSDMRAYMSLVTNVLGYAENYLTWVEGTTYSQVTKVRYGSVYYFPLNHILPYLKRQSVIKKLAAFGWYNKTIDEVYEQVDQCCLALSDRLGNQKYFFGEKLCELDAAVFGHLYAILTTPSFPCGLKFADIVRAHRPLVNHCKRIMPLLKLMSNIDESKAHLHFAKLFDSKTSSDHEEKTEDEFVYYDEDEVHGSPMETQDVGSHIPNTPLL